jgi:hypothetical protein
LVLLATLNLLLEFAIAVTLALLASQNSDVEY